MDTLMTKEAINKSSTNNELGAAGRTDTAVNTAFKSAFAPVDAPGKAPDQSAFKSAFAPVDAPGKAPDQSAFKSAFAPVDAPGKAPNQSAFKSAFAPVDAPGKVPDQSAFKSVVAPAGGNLNISSPKGSAFTPSFGNVFSKASSPDKVAFQHSMTSPVALTGFSFQSTLVTDATKQNELLPPSNDNAAFTSNIIANTQSNKTSTSVAELKTTSDEPQVEDDVWRCSACEKIKDLRGAHLNNKLEVRSDCWPCGKKQTFVRSGSNACEGKDSDAIVPKMVASEPFIAKKDFGKVVNESLMKCGTIKALSNAPTVIEREVVSNIQDTKIAWKCNVCNKVKDLHGPHLAGRTEVRSDCWPCGKKQTFSNSRSKSPINNTDKSILLKMDALPTLISSAPNQPEHFRLPSIPEQEAEASFIISEPPVSALCKTLPIHTASTSKAAPAQPPFKNASSSPNVVSAFVIKADCSAEAISFQSIENVEGKMWRCNICNKAKDLHGPHLAGRTEVRSDCWPCGKKQTFICTTGVSTQAVLPTHNALTKAPINLTNNNNTFVDHEALAEQKSTSQVNVESAQTHQPEAASKLSFNDNHSLKSVVNQKGELATDRVNFEHTATEVLEKIREEAINTTKLMRIDFDAEILNLRNRFSDFVFDKGDKDASMMTNAMNAHIQELKCIMKENQRMIEQTTSKAIENAKSEILIELDRKIEKGFEEIRKEISRLVTDISLDFLGTVAQRESAGSNRSHPPISQSTHAKQNLASRHLSNAFE